MRRRRWRFRLGRLGGFNGDDSVLKGSDAVGVDLVAEKFELSLSEDALWSLDDHTVGGEDLKHLVQILQVLLERLGGDEYIVDVNEYTWQIS